MVNVQELSDMFDVLYNNITSNQAAGLNEYEKSVFLTKAQEEIIKNYFSPKANPKGEGFDDSPKRQADFATLINNRNYTSFGIGTFDLRSKSCVLPDDMFLCLNEQFLDGSLPLTVVPISYEEYDRLMAKPYKFPPKYQVWRLITKNQSGNNSYPTIEPGENSYTVKDLQNNSVYTFYIATNSLVPVNVTISLQDPGHSGTSPEPIAIDASDENEINIVITVPLSYITDSTKGIAAFKEVIDESNISQYLSYLSWPSELENGVVTYMNTDIEITAVATQTTITSNQTVPIAEFIGRFNSGNLSYRIRYVKKPLPIVLTNITPLSIQGKSTVQRMDLPDELYEEILQRAVELAKVAWTNNGQDNVALAIEAGKRSE